jgi:hypothetical protein
MAKLDGNKTRVGGAKLQEIPVARKLQWSMHTAGIRASRMRNRNAAAPARHAPALFQEKFSMTHFFGDEAFYARLCLMTDILGKFVSCAPRAIDLDQLVRETGRSRREVARLCDVLCREELLLQADPRKRRWRLGCEPSTVTLEDAYRCALATQPRAKSASKAEFSAEEHAPRDVDLLLMQASMSVNQSVLRLLRQFSLDRLKVTAAGMFPHRKVDLDSSWTGARFSPL